MSTEKLDICKFGKELFGRFYGGIISKDQLREEIIAAQESFISNDWAVIHCFCENDKDVCLLLCDLELRWDIPTIFQVGVSPRITSVFILQECKIALERDSYFHTSEFSILVKDVWKEVCGSHWNEFKSGAEKMLIRLPFFQKEFDIIFK